MDTNPSFKNNTFASQPGLTSSGTTVSRFINQVFKLTDHRTTVRTECFAGLTTFLTMAYIIFIQPAILSKDFLGNPTGLDFGSVLLATCLSSAVGSIFMGLWARYPIALAPGMGENFFFVSVIMTLTSLGFADAWQVALGIVFISGIIFLILSIARIREMILNSVSPSMRYAIAVGIGFFIAFIGLRSGGVIVGKPGTLVALAPQLYTAPIAVFFFGFILTAVLHARRIRGAILIGILGSTGLALCLGQIHLPSAIFGLPEIKHNIIFKMDLVRAIALPCIPFIIVFVFMDVFDTIGTLIGVAQQAGYIKDDKLPRAGRVLVVDSAASCVGACLGTSTVLAYVESITGVEYGGRTGLTSVVTGIFFLFAIIFSPVIAVIANFPPITAPALIIVGTMMIQNVKRIDWDRYDECIPAFLTIIGIPLTYSIADGLICGFISYPIVKFLSGKGKEVKWMMYVLAAILLAYMLLLRPKAA